MLKELKFESCGTVFLFFNSDFQDIPDIWGKQNKTKPKHTLSRYKNHTYQCMSHIQQFVPRVPF